MPAVKDKAIASYFAEIAELPDGTYYILLTATTVDDQEPQLICQEIDSRCGAPLDEVLAVIRDGISCPF
jgi:hypothetical protein